MVDRPRPRLRIVEAAPVDPAVIRRQRDQRRALVVCAVTALLAAFLLFGSEAARRETEWIKATAGGGGDVSRPPREDVLRGRLIGRWQRSFFGRQELSICPDGTATVVAHPSGFWAWLLGDRLEVRFAWQLRDGLLIYHVTGGRPEAKIEVARSMWGDHFVQRIRTLNETTLILEWADGDIDHWFRCRSRVSER